MTVRLTQANAPLMQTMAARDEYGATREIAADANPGNNTALFTFANSGQMGIGPGSNTPSNTLLLRAPNDGTSIYMRSTTNQAGAGNIMAALLFGDNLAALRYAAIIGVFAAGVFILGIIATQWEESV